MATSTSPAATRSGPEQASASTTPVAAPARSYSSGPSRPGARPSRRRATRNRRRTHASAMPFDDRGDPLGDDPPARDVVGHEQRLRAAHDEVVDDHADEVEADRVVHVHPLRDRDLRAHAVRRWSRATAGGSRAARRRRTARRSRRSRRRPPGGGPWRPTRASARRPGRRPRCRPRRRHRSAAVRYRRHVAVDGIASACWTHVRSAGAGQGGRARRPRRRRRQTPRVDPADSRSGATGSSASARACACRSSAGSGSVDRVDAVEAGSAELVLRDRGGRDQTRRARRSPESRRRSSGRSPRSPGRWR